MHTTTQKNRKAIPPMPTITNEIKQAVRYVLIATVWHDLIKPIVRDYQRRILHEMQAKHLRSGELILNPECVHGMSDEDFKTYLNLCKICREALNLQGKYDDSCPLMEAENMLLRMKQRFVDYILPAIAHIMKDVRSETIKYNQQFLERFVDLNLRWLVQQIPELNAIKSTTQEECNTLIQEIRNATAAYCGNG